MMCPANSPTWPTLDMRWHEPRESAQRVEVMRLLGASASDTSGGWHHSVGVSLPRWRLCSSYLHSQDKAMAIKGVLPV